LILETGVDCLDNAARDHLQRCFVLHRRDFGNSSLILEVFGSAHGRVAVLAKGAKQSRRGRGASGAVLQSFQPLWLSWSGRGEVKTLLRFEPVGPAVGLSGKTLFCGFYLNELLVRLLGRGDPHEALFAFYCSALTSLAAGEEIESVLRQFELRLLHEIGYSVVLDVEAVSGRPVESDLRYVYEQELGLRVAGAGDSQSSVSGETLLRLAVGEPLQGQMTREARALLRRLLAPYLGARPLKSRELFRRWRS
jgi:DNA repair protein RecO (recombination protein O)